jgi:hypothetical protein
VDGGKFVSKGEGNGENVDPTLVSITDSLRVCRGGWNVPGTDCLDHFFHFSRENLSRDRPVGVSRDSFSWSVS